MNNIKRLEELLDIKDNKIEELESELNKYKIEEENDIDRENWKWTIHKNLSEKENMDLPIPRLELKYNNLTDDCYNSEWEYYLVYKHLLGDIICVPLGYTKVSGGNKAPIYDGKINLLFRDGAHIKNEAKQLNIPAYVICEGKIELIC